MITDFLYIFEKLTLLQWGILISFMVVFLIRFSYLFLFTARLLFVRNRKIQAQTPAKLSLLTTIRNEEGNIRKNLPRILQLDQDFEVVVVDDFSQDNSLSVLGLLTQRYSRLKISSLSQETRYSEKLSQNIALKSASNSWVMLVPVSLNEVNKNWVPSFTANLDTDRINLIIAYSTVAADNGIFNLLYRIENFYQQVKSVGYVCNNIPFVYNEENVAFRKELYFRLGGYAKNIQEPYANLELIINQFIKKRTSFFNISSISTIQKQIEIHREEYLDLFKKSIRIEKYLPFWKRLVLVFDEITQLLFIPLIIAIALCCFDLWLLIIVLVGLKIGTHVLIIKIALNRLNERKIFIPSLVYGLMFPFFKLLFRWHFNRTNRKHKWRSRA